MSVVVVLVLLFISFPVDGVGVGRCSCPLVLCSLVTAFCSGSVPSKFIDNLGMRPHRLSPALT